jgi:hypothetical protein
MGLTPYKHQVAPRSTYWTASEGPSRGPPGSPGKGLVQRYRLGPLACRGSGTKTLLRDACPRLTSRPTREAKALWGVVRETNALSGSVVKWITALIQTQERTQLRVLITDLSLASVLMT